MGAKAKVLIAATLGLAVIVLLAVVLQRQTQQSPQQQIPITPTRAAVPQSDTNTFSYKGEDGQDALTLLRSKTDVEQDKSGLVISINGKKADSSKREYWAFYVNGELSSSGPKDYITKNDDLIEWKVENY